MFFAVQMRFRVECTTFNIGERAESITLPTAVSSLVLGAKFLTLNPELKPESLSRSSFIDSDKGL